MSYSLLFVPLSNDPASLARVPVARVRELFERFEISAPEFKDGENEFSLFTRKGAQHQICEDTVLLVAKGGEVCSLSIERPASGASGRHLWYALVADLGFVMIPSYGGPVFVSGSVAQECAATLGAEHFPEGVRLVTDPEQLP